MLQGGSIAAERSPPEPEPPSRPPAPFPGPATRAAPLRAAEAPAEASRQTRQQAIPAPWRQALESQRQTPHLSASLACAILRLAAALLGLAARCWPQSATGPVFFSTARRRLSGHWPQFHLPCTCVWPDSRALRPQIPLLAPGSEHSLHCLGLRAAAARSFLFSTNLSFSAGGGLCAQLLLVARFPRARVHAC